MLSRRGFLAALAAATAGAAFDPERLLWVPKPMIVVPARPTFLTPDIIAREALAVLERNLVAMQGCLEVLEDPGGGLSVRWSEVPPFVIRRA